MDQIGEEHFPWKGTDEIKDLRDRAIGAYGETMDLFIGKYSMGTYEHDVLIKKGVHLKKETYDLLADFFHSNAVRILDFYHEDKNHGRFVVSKVDASFLEWLKAVGKESMFHANGDMKPLFRNMIIELCDLVKCLLEKGIVISNNFSMQDLYLTLSHDGPPKLVLLLTEVKKPMHPAHDVKVSWDSIRMLINSCCTACDVELNSWVKNFCDFIGGETFTIEKLKGYPDTWDYNMKGDYLILLHTADQSTIRSKIKRSGVTWPFCGRVLPDLLNGIIKGAKVRYNEKDPYEYTALLKNSYKHFEDLPYAVQFTLGNREGLLKQIERWSPDIWKKLYEIIGTP